LFYLVGFFGFIDCTNTLYIQGSIINPGMNKNRMNVYKKKRKLDAILDMFIIRQFCNLNALNDVHQSTLS